MLRYKSPAQTLVSFLEYVFCIQSRIIIRCLAIDEFEAPGMFLLAPLKPVAGLKKHKIRCGEEVWVRSDNVLERVELEIFSDPTKINSIVYRLTFDEFDSIKGKLQEIPFCEGQERPHSWDDKKCWRFDGEKKN